MSELNSEQTAIQRDRGAIESELRAAGARFKGTSSCTCPFHEDTNPSAMMKKGSDGVYRFHCFVCLWHGDVFDVRAKVRGCDLAEVLKEVRPYEQVVEKPRPRIYASLEEIIAHYSNVEAVYKYTHPETKAIELAVIRYRKETRKAFAQCSPRDGGWVAGRPEGKLPLYNRSRVVDADEVCVVEGEKAVHALTDVGVVATTSPMGAGKSGEANWSPLKGKTVYLWPDNDPTDEKTGLSVGIEHMKAVQAILEAMDCRIYWIDPAGLELPAKGDAYDFLQKNGGTTEDKQVAIKLVLSNAKELDIAGEIKERIIAMTEGRWRNIPWPEWDGLTAKAQALLPGMLTAVLGDPGSTKSFALLQAFCHWHIIGEHVALFALENDRQYHLQRVLAQLERNSHLTDTEWVRNNAQKALAHYENQRDILNSFGRTITTSPNKIVTHDTMIKWIEAQCQAGAQILGIDPVTALEPTGKPWIDDQRFIFNAMEILSKYGARLIYVIHPKLSNDKNGTALARMAGGASYPRFSHTVLWIRRTEDGGTTNGRVWPNGGMQQDGSYNRTIKLAKANNGIGAGMTLAYMFSAESLTLTEVGMVCEETRSTTRGARNIMGDN